MRIIFLNSWFGKTGKPFFNFVEEEAPKTDIFCFMEFFQQLFDEVSKMLPDHQGFIEKGRFLEYFNEIDCQTVFARRNLKILSSSKLDLYKTTSTDTGFAFYIAFEMNGKIINILDVHGKAEPGSKNDTPARIRQSQKIIDFMSDKKGIRIVGGDFNLNPNTKSVKIFEEEGYKNLIKDYKIENTRNEVSWKNYKDTPGFVKQHFADYCFVSSNVKVKNFEVPYNEVSDHLPLILEFEI